MQEGKEELLNGVDDSKRDFIRKLAIGSAYAVPVMASFPLDSVRSKARAQGTYGPPAVVNIRGVADTEFDPSAGQATASTGHYTAYWVITFDRRMDKRFKDALYYDTFGEPCGEVEGAATGPVCELEKISKCGDGDAWSWTEDGSRLYKGISICNGNAEGLNIILNPGGECEQPPFRDLEGTRLPRTDGCADYCEERDVDCEH